MNLGPNKISLTYQYVLNQSGSAITLGNGGAVNWAANGLILNTGNQTISGVKTFASSIIGNLNGSISGNAATVTNGVYTIGDQSISGVKTFVESVNISGDCILGSDLSANAFGYLSPSNSFGNEAAINDFGMNASANSFGAYSFNTIGSFAAENQIGLNAISNYFGEAPDTLLATVNNFGSYAQNKFGASGSNIFGLDASNEYGSGLFAGPIRLFLPQFSGSSSQTGQTGELKVSGSGLYICTGANAWGRIFISSF